MLSRLLRSVGHTCDEASDGQMAVEQAKAERAAGRSYDAILMDFIMPRMDGPTATKGTRVVDAIRVRVSRGGTL